MRQIGSCYLAKLKRCAVEYGLKVHPRIDGQVTQISHNRHNLSHVFKLDPTSILSIVYVWAVMLS